MPSANLDKGYRSPTTFDRFRKWAAIELQYLPDTIKAHPITSTLAGIGLAAASGMCIQSLNKHFETKAALPQIITQTSHLAVTDTWGIQRQGVVFNGVAIPKVDAANTAAMLTSEALKRYVPAGDAVMGCKTVDLRLSGENASLLRFLTSEVRTVSTFNNAAFSNGEYTCHGKTLNGSLPRPFSVRPSSVAPQAQMLTPLI